MGNCTSQMKNTVTIRVVFDTLCYDLSDIAHLILRQELSFESKECEKQNMEFALLWGLLGSRRYSTLDSLKLVQHFLRSQQRSQQLSEPLRLTYFNKLHPTVSSTLTRMCSGEIIPLLNEPLKEALVSRPLRSVYDPTLSSYERDQAVDDAYPLLRNPYRLWEAVLRL